MANRTDTDARALHGKDPQNLVEYIVRTRVYDSLYWKQHCFGANAADVVGLAAELQYVGGQYGEPRRPAPFLCLLLKLLQIGPSSDVILEYVRTEDLKYLRLLGAAYVRLTARPEEVYRFLEPLLADPRRVRVRALDGSFSLSHVDEIVDGFLTTRDVVGIAAPALQRRDILEARGGLHPRISPLQDDYEERKREQKRKQQKEEEEEEEERMRRREGEKETERRRERAREEEAEEEEEDRGGFRADRRAGPEGASTSRGAVGSRARDASSWRLSARERRQDRERLRKHEHDRRRGWTGEGEGDDSRRGPRGRGDDGPDDSDDDRRRRHGRLRDRDAVDDSLLPSAGWRREEGGRRGASGREKQSDSSREEGERGDVDARGPRPAARGHGAAASVETDEIAQANALRASLGLKPLRM